MSCFPRLFHSLFSKIDLTVTVTMYIGIQGVPKVRGRCLIVSHSVVRWPYELNCVSVVAQSHGKLVVNVLPSSSSRFREMSSFVNVKIYIFENRAEFAMRVSKQLKQYLHTVVHLRTIPSAALSAWSGLHALQIPQFSKMKMCNCCKIWSYLWNGIS